MLRDFAWRRMGHAWRTTGRTIQVQVALAAIGLPALIADYAQRFYTTGPRDVPDALVPWIVRVLLLLVLIAGLLAVRLARGLFLGASDESFLAATPISPAARYRYRAWQLGLLLVPVAWLGLGGVLPLAWNGDAGLLVRAATVWIAWVAFVWAWASATAAAGPIAGRGRGLYESLAGIVPALALFGARWLGAPLVRLEDRDSLWVTATLGVALAGLVAWQVPKRAGILGRRERALERLHVHGRKLERHRRARRLRRSARHPALAIAARNLRLGLRSPRVGGTLVGAVLLKVAGLALAASAFAPEPAGPSWVFAGVLLVFGDALLGGALISIQAFEQPPLFFGAPLSRLQHWLGLAGPAVALSGCATLLLAGAAGLSVGGGVARFILAWCGLAGLSLLVTGANLALASFPNTALAQNLYWTGLGVCMVLSAAIPLFGWVVLVAFALYSFRQLRHWGED